MKWLLVLLLCAPTFAWANGETLYVRPVGACTNNGDGTAYGCAASGGAAGAYKGFLNVLYAATNTAKKVDPGDKLYVCGTHTTTFPNISQSGVAGPPILYIDLDGRCPSDAGTIDPDPGSNNFAAYSTANYTEFEYLTLGGGDIGVVSLQHGAVTSTVNGGWVHHNTIAHGTGDITQPCLDFYGSDVIITDNTVFDCALDAIFSHGGARATISRNVISNYSNGDTTGDGIQLSFAKDGSVIANNEIHHADRDTKYCIIAADESDAGTVWIVGNTCYRQSTDTIGSGIYVEVNANIYSNYIFGGVNGVQCAAQSVATWTCNVVGNVSVSASGRGIINGVNNANTQVIGNTIISAGVEGFFSANTAAGVLIKNNIVSNAASKPCINKQTSNVEQYNDLFGCMAPVQNNGSGTSVGSHTVTTDPLFVNSGAGNYALQAGSPAKRTGLTWTNFCNDRRGRPCLSPPNMGAYADGSGDPSLARSAAATRSVTSTRSTALPRAAR